MSEEPGFEVASAYVSVSPDAASFPEQLEEQIGDVNFVVQIPVVPDAGDFAGQVEAEVGETDLAVQVPVVPDTSGFQMLLDDAVEEAKATVTVPVVPDAAGFPEAVDEAVSESDKAVTIPVVPDMAGFAETAEAAAEASGDAAGSVFSEQFAVAAMPRLSGLFSGDASMIGEAGAAREEAGMAFASEFIASALPRLSALFSGDASLISESGAAGEEAGMAFSRSFTAATAGLKAPLAEVIPAAETEAEDAGEVAGTGFLSRFTSGLGKLTAPLAAAFSGAEAEGEAGGLAAGEGFASKLKSAITGDISPMEALMGAAFVGAAAEMASKFQATMEQIHTQAQVGQSAIAGLSAGVLNLAGQVGSSPDSLAEALYHIESTFSGMGLSGQKAMQLLQTAAEGARVGNANLVDTTNALDATVVSGIKGAQNYSQAMGALNGIVGAGDMTMQNLNETMTTGLMANAKLYGQSLPQVGAALDTLGDNLIRGAKAGTDLRMAWQAMLDPLSTAGPMLDSIGLKAGQLGTTLTHAGFSQAIDLFVQHLQASKVPVADWGTYVTDIFGKKAGAGIGVLVENYGRLDSKFALLSKDSQTFGNAWSSTQDTMKQKVAELESGFEALMIKIGDGLLPAVNAFMGMVSRNLPAIERFGTEIAHLVAPVVTLFFTGLEAILKVLFGPMRDVTLAVIGLAAAWGALNVIMDMNPFVAIGAALIILVGLIVKYHKQILDVIEKTWNTVAHFFTSTANTLFKPVEKAFDDFQKYITSGFDKWWASHGKEIEKVWNDAWKKIKADFTAAWDFIAPAVKVTMTVIETDIKVGLDEIATVFKIAWAAITEVFKDAWDIMAAVVKIAWAGIEATVKIAWDVIVGLFDIAIDLLTGHWSKAWDDLLTMLTQVWNAIKEEFGTIWNAISALAVQILNNLTGFFTSSWNAIKSGVTTAWNDIYSSIKGVWGDIVSFTETTVNGVILWLKTSWDTIWSDIKTIWGDISSWFTTWWNSEVSSWENTVTTVEGWLKGAWNTIKTDAVEGFDEVRSAIASIWDGIVSDAENFINEIISKIQGIGKSIVSLPGKLLGDIGLAGGGVLPGYAPGHDTISAKLSPGEAVLVPEAVRAIGPGTINAINAHYRAGRGGGGDGYALGGLVPGYAAGGIAGDGLSPYAAGQAAGAGQQMYGYGASTLERNGITVSFNYYGTQQPTPEQQQAMMMQLAAAVGVS